MRTGNKLNLNRVQTSIRTQVASTEIYARAMCRPGRREPVIVLIHGLGVSSRYMVPVAQRLFPSFDVYAPDLPGFGKSGKPDHVFDISELAATLVTWMDRLDLTRVVALGNSFGCQVIAEMATLHPRRLERSILVGPTTDPHARTTPNQAGRLLRDIPWEPLSLLPLNLRDYVACGPARLWQTYRHALADPIEDKLPHMNLPTLVVRGDHDPIVSQRWAEEAAALLPLGSLEVVPGAGHAVNYNSPAPLSALVTAFVAGAGDPERPLPPP